MNRLAYYQKYYQDNKKPISIRQSAYQKTEIGRRVGRQKVKRYRIRRKSDPVKYANYLLKSRARNALQYAVRVGKLKRKPCEVCGKSKAEAHHDDYNFPLQVRWLCKLCHEKNHAEEAA